MKKYLVYVAILIGLLMAGVASAQTPSAPNFWKVVANVLQPLSSAYGLKLNITGSTQCLHVNTAGTVSGTGSDCGSGGGGSGTVTSVDLTAPTGLTVSGNPVTTSGTLALSLQAGYNIPLSASTTNWNNFYNNVLSRLAVATGTSGTIFNISTSTNSITINLPTASASNSGQLSATDWSTFNNKQAALVSGTNIKTINGSSILGSGDLSVAGGGSGGLGTTSPFTAGYIPEATGTSVTLSNSNLFQSTAGNIGIGTITPTTTLFIQGTGGTNPFAIASSTGTPLVTVTQAGNVGFGNSAPADSFDINNNQSAPTAMRITNTSTGGSGQADIYLNNSSSFGQLFKTSTGYTPYKTIAAADLGFYNSGGNISVLNDAGNINFTAGGASTAQMLLSTTGLLGIGTITPNSLLHVHGDASSTANTALYTFASTNPIIELGQKPLSSPSANGTYMGINTPSTFTGNYMDFQNAGTSKFTVASTGNIVTKGSLQVGSNSFTMSGNGTLQAASGADLQLIGSNGGNNLDSVLIKDANNRTAVNGDQQTLLLQGTYAPTSGTGTFQLQNMAVTINQTGGANGITRGIYLIPALTKAADFRALEVSTYTYNLGTGYAGGTLYQNLFNPYTVASSTAGIIANAQMLTIGGAPIAGTNITITSSTALTILSNSVTASTTNAQGLWVAAPTGATNNYAALFSGGNVGIGTTSPIGQLVIQGTGSQVKDYLTIASSTGSSVFSIAPASSAQLFIGTSTPLGTLVVSGGSATTTIDFDSDSATQGTCLKLKNASGSGYTYCVANSGSLTCSTTSCQ